ncbi:DUF2169 family type VI secretion system accessory protein [Caldimonas brevitalea]|uniref:DUF2169 domain-containing protein n=1 Tax=Caldimonas brevitalea TaxID=413882 RepID=A0A0G3BJW0_9BURK|nr:DUF2169 domain-containing protein [Caldimonas brevitalea]AKJ29687.1 hypothetical protein AAW51_2996 [Caldimonas brevitalea]
MELVNATRMEVGHTLGLEPSGRELLVIVIKGTFRLPATGEPVQLHDEQLPLVMADTFTGEPGYSAPYFEIDFAPRKHRCDILLQGSAYAPQGRPVERVGVGLQVGPLRKTFSVVGNRRWETGLSGIGSTPPTPFTRCSISYDVAYGGVDQEHEDPAKHDAYALNPAGRGFRKHFKSEWVDGRPLPNTEEIGQEVRQPDGDYRPMAFGPVGRGWEPRRQWAGTYDQQWLDDHFPFLPPDFDERYYQAAPPDQQIEVPRAAHEVVLLNLTDDGHRRFLLPHFEAPVHIFPRHGERENLNAALDTICFEPDQGRFTMSWRVTRPLKKNLFEIAQVLVGKKGREWWQRRDELSFPIPVVMVPMPPAEAAPASPA